MGVVEQLKTLASVDIFKQGRDPETFVGRPFYFDYARTKALVNDKWKASVGGIPVCAFLLASYEGEPDVDEMVLVRVLGPTALPTDSDVVASMVDYYKETAPPSGSSQSKLDTFTKYEFQFSGLECRILGTFYRDDDGKPVFGADIDNFFSPHNYSLFKPTGKVLEYIVNFREGEGIPGGDDQVRLGEVRYSSSRRHLPAEPAPVYVSALDFVGKRTALFGMTRTGKSNTVKKIIEATVDMSNRGVQLDGEPLKPVGQVIFDVNGEYANANQQDEGTAVFELFDDATTRYSLLDKPGFEVMKLNFYRDIEGGFGLINANLAAGGADYISSFLAVDLEEPDASDIAAQTRWERVVAAYRACLHAAGFPMGSFRIKFQGNKELNALAGGIDPSKGMTGDQAVTWLTAVWDNYTSASFFTNYQTKNGREWADEDLKAMLIMLTRKKKPGGSASVSGFLKLRNLKPYHTDIDADSFEAAIVEQVRQGRIVIVDLSQGDPVVQSTFSERICRRVFDDAMQRFIKNEAANYVQLYFEEAHNLFPKRDDKDLSQIYNRIAKEGAKMRLGLIYATQEPSSISSNVLKNTQNWFVSHLNNADELREVEKYYDFGDFSEGLRRAPDRGYIRMKAYSNSFIVPVQIDRFVAAKDAD
jgi:DNA helicase HerA-like ATPase